MILAIDDDPARYEHLQRLLEGCVEVIVACCPVCVSRLLPKASAVLLDFDLNLEDFCTCGRPYAEYKQWSNTLPYVPAVAARQVPVVVTSASSGENIRALCQKLRAYDVRFGQYRACDIDPEYNWIGRLWAMGALDRVAAGDSGGDRTDRWAAGLFRAGAETTEQVIGAHVPNPPQESTLVGAPQS